MHRRDGKLIVSATDLVGFLECGHLTRLERAAAAGLVHKPDREDPEIELLQRRGGEHEQRYIEQLERDGRRVTKLTADWERPYEERAAETAQLMRRGDDVIYQATVFDGRWVGHPDFLLRVPPVVTEAVAGLGSPVPSMSRLVRSKARDGVGIDITDSTVGGEVGGDVGGDSQLEGESAGELRGLGTDWHYEVADTKLAHSAKASALIQICSYVDQIERIQGFRPEKVHVVLGGATIKTESFRTAEMMAYYRRAKARFEAAIDEAISGAEIYPIPLATSYPDPVEHCGVCRWYPDHCWRRWREDDALPLVAGIGRTQREVLRAHDVTTRDALAKLTQPFELGLKRGQNDAMGKTREQARLQVESSHADKVLYELLKPEQDSEGSVTADRGLAALPQPAVGDLFFDIEGDPFAFWEGLEYLFGVWERPPPSGEDGYTGFWALDREHEKQAFERVMDLFMARRKQYPDMHIYHYAPYEPTALKRLAGRHGTREAELDELLRGRVFVDLYRVVRQGVRVGAEGYSIKKLEPLYGYEREIELRDAGSSIVEFEKVLEVGDVDGAIKERIRLYNRDDCISTEKLRDWLEARRPQAASEFGAELPRPPTEVQEASEELSDRQRAVHELEEKLKATEDEATVLLAHLLDWHRRENKQAWWRFYDLMAKSGDDLFEEADPIGRLEFVGIVEGGGTRASDDYRYRFPAQEHRVDEGVEVHDPQLVAGETRTGTVQAIDKDAGTIDIRRRKGWSGQHPSSIVPRNIYRAVAQQDALMRIGEWVVHNGIDSPMPDYRAARDLLLRLPPRVVGTDGGALVHEDETGTQAALRLAATLDGTTLPIQGPPGSGKTHTGARMILGLVNGQPPRTVGVTANSHKVISNLLKAVGDAGGDGREAGARVRGMQKVDGDDGCKADFVECVDDNGVVERALVDGRVDVVGGTAWLWARAQMAGLVDTLFVDEAGQMSLANVVAMSAAARNVVLLGDPQQLDQPTQGAHPAGAGRSALAHILGAAKTVPDDRGVFLEQTYRMHPTITAYTSELFYEGKLTAVDGLERQRVVGAASANGLATDWLSGSGLRWVPVEHDGNTNSSEEEARKVVEIVQALVGRGWVDGEGKERPITPQDIRIVSPFNAHRLLIGRLLKEADLGATPVGTVDKFQGQQATVSIYTMATSRPEDAPRGIDFLYSLNRLNVATSRAKALAIVVCSTRLLDVLAHTPDQVRMANGLCAFVEAAT